jgi:SAM-dependent methyltransferase
VDEYSEANRALWDEWTAIHLGSEFYDVERFKEGGIRLRAYELDEIGEVAGRDVLHLQCHFGLDTLSFARLGARVTGADFSAPAIEAARALSREAGLDARFVHSDVYELPDRLEGDFDIVYTSRGVIGWLPDLERWAEVAAHFVRPGGFFYITEGHPVMWAFDDDEGVTDLRLRYPYWARQEPLRFRVQGSYADRAAKVEQEYEYSWPHGLGEVVTAVARAGLRIEFLHEFPFVDWPVPFLERHEDGTWRLPAGRYGEGELPLFFSLRATKPA